MPRRETLMVHAHGEEGVRWVLPPKMVAALADGSAFDLAWATQALKDEAPTAPDAIVALDLRELERLMELHTRALTALRGLAALRDSDEAMSLGTARS